jgi:hypothetical protein
MKVNVDIDIEALDAQGKGSRVHMVTAWHGFGVAGDSLASCNICFLYTRYQFATSKKCSCLEVMFPELRRVRKDGLPRCDCGFGMSAVGFAASPYSQQCPNLSQSIE